MPELAYLEDRVLEQSFTGKQHIVRLWEARKPRAVILAIHGGMAHSGDYATVGDYFRPHEVTTISFDLSGHGRQSRIDIPHFDVFLEDVKCMLDWTTAHYSDLPIVLMGHSMGALIATHMELSGQLGAYPVSGIVLSSPYYANAIPVPPLMIRLSSLLATLFPTAKVPMEPVTHWLTHDTAITARHFEDEKTQRRGTEVSFRFGRALLDAQAALNQDLSCWQHPVFAVIAGSDHLADAEITRKMLQSVPSGLLDLHYFPDNFHENFNEMNREDIFSALWNWIQLRLN